MKANHQPRRFAPLKQTTAGKDNELPKLKGVVFDVDGTLWYDLRFYFLAYVY